MICPALGQQTLAERAEYGKPVKNVGIDRSDLVDRVRMPEQFDEWRARAEP
ncbi:hypothetical protein GCM10015535_32550 [Streptomyces gelaticus]|uniref:Uncharacterized protein n=1 Tax=Streptomyces gelaticus TaxID=285446 RepID=A0ABQ2VZF6_9ACTN|nr:hypothetical protein [Streptomyces gelaticus]GGV85627.1 hypothetical protein GCM10015535_32550 [Streptomyces gelaticus]